MNFENDREVEQALRKHLSRTAAPEELWSRVRTARAQESVRERVQAGRPAWFAWASAAAAFVVMAGAGYSAWRLYQPEVSVQAMAVDALKKGPAHLAIQSSDPKQIREWARLNSAVDVPLPALLKSHDIQVVGANILTGPKSEGSPRIAEVSYLIGGYRAELLISSNPSGQSSYPKHKDQEVTPRNGARVTSWSMRGQNYTLASSAPSEFKTACTLCHAGSDSRIN